MAARRSKSELLQKLWEWATEKLTEEINNELLLEKYFCKQNVWHIAAMQDKVIWQWDKENLTAHDLYNKLLLTKDYSSTPSGILQQCRATQYGSGLQRN